MDFKFPLLEQHQSRMTPRLIEVLGWLAYLAYSHLQTRFWHCSGWSLARRLTTKIYELVERPRAADHRP